MRNRARNWLIAIASLAAAGTLATLWLYQRYIGFAGAPLASQLPQNAYAYLGVTHLRRTALSASNEPGLQALGTLAQALAQASAEALTSDWPDSQPESEPEPNAASAAAAATASFEDLAPYFKSQIGLALLPGSVPIAKGGAAEPLLMARFTGSEDDLFETLVRLSPSVAGATRPEQWKREDWNGRRIHWLEKPLRAAETDVGIVALGSLTPAWTVSDGTFYLARSPEALKRLLVQIDGRPDGANSLADLPAFSRRPTRAPQGDVVAYLAISPLLRALAERKQAVYAADPLDPMNFVDFSSLISALGLDRLQAFSFATDLTGEQTAFLGLSYTQKAGLLSALRSVDTLPAAQTAEDFGAAETIALNLGEALLATKKAAQAAAPFAMIAYYPIQRRAASVLGADPETLLSQSFAPQTSLSATLDIGTVRGQDGRLAESIVPDVAVEAKLLPGNLLAETLPRAFAYLAQTYPASVRFYPDATAPRIEIDRDPDATVTGGRFACAIDDERLVLGFGTLRTFGLRLAEKSAPAPATDDAPPVNASRIGNGALRIENGAARLRQLAPVFYRQLNPGAPLPTELLDFDWTEFDALDQERVAHSYDTGDGLFYRISRRR